MDFLPTAQCRKYPDTWRGVRPELPLAHMDDTDIDEALSQMLRDGVTINDIPRSQYGRRVAVDTMFKLERGTPIQFGVSVPTPYRPGHAR